MDRNDIRVFSEDQIILREGEVNSEMFRIVSGQAAMYFDYGKDTEYLIGVLGEGRYVGQISMLTGIPNPFTCIALNGIMALSIDRNDFADFVREEPHSAVNIMKSLAGMVVTMSSNINQVKEELMKEISAGSDITAKHKGEIEKRIMRYRVSGLQGSPYYASLYNNQKSGDILHGERTY